MTSTSDALAVLIDQPLQPLPPRWRSARQAALLAEARAAETAGIDEYWAWAARRFRWSRPWDAVRTGGMTDLRYFVGGTLNVADNCVDRHAEDPARRDKPAVIWEGEDGAVRTLTYRDAARRGGALRQRPAVAGVRRGDVVAIYLPNLPEAFVAIHACNRIGAIYTVLFSGFSSEAVALRLGHLARGVRRHRRRELPPRPRVPLLDNLRAARGRAPRCVTWWWSTAPARGGRCSEGERGWSALLGAQIGRLPVRAAGGQRPGLPDLHQRHGVAAQGRGAQRRRLPDRHLGQRAVAGRAGGGRRVLVRGRRRLAHLPDPGGDRRPGARRHDPVLRGRARHALAAAVLRDRGAPQGHQDPDRADRAAHAARRGRRRRGEAPAARAEARDRARASRWMPRPSTGSARTSATTACRSSTPTARPRPARPGRTRSTAWTTSRPAPRAGRCPGTRARWWTIDGQPAPAGVRGNLVLTHPFPTPGAHHLGRPSPLPRHLLRRGRHDLSHLRRGGGGRGRPHLGAGACGREHFGGFEVDQDVIFCDDLSLLALKQLTQ